MYRICVRSFLYACPADPGFIPLNNTVDPDQMVSDKAIWSGSTLFPTMLEKNVPIAEMLQVKG